MEILAIIIAAVVGIGVMVIFFRPIFSDRYEFWECIKFWLTPNIISMFRGEYLEDLWSEMKLFFWLASGAIPGFLTYLGLVHAFGT